MAEEFEGDLAGAVFWGADLRGARFRDVDLTGATITHATMANVDIDALVERLVVNGVDVTAYVNDRDPWYPLRAMLRPATPADMAPTVDALEAAWGETIARARTLPEARLHESVGGEFSFVQTLRHVVFATDKWFTAPIAGGRFHPIGLPNTGSREFPWPGLDYDLAPSVAEALAVASDRATSVRRYVTSVRADELDRPVDVLENGPHSVLECLHTVFEETFWHTRYARRDLALLGAAG